MFSAIRRRATYANVVMTFALVFAMTGGAYAAKKYLITSTKQISPSVLKSLQGKTGAAGAAGAVGPQGAAGPQGPAGKDGANGKDGAPGGKGQDGKSVVAANLNPGEEGCAEGGTSFEVQGAGVKHQACNGTSGTEGAEGPAGSPWVVGEAPSGAVLKGTWVLPPATATAGNEHFYSAISTGVPVSYLAEIGSIGVFAAPVSPYCPEGSAEEPEAGIGGVLCVFVAHSTNLGTTQTGLSKLGSSRGGVLIGFASTEAGPVSAYGSWAYRVP